MKDNHIKFQKDVSSILYNKVENQHCADSGIERVAKEWTEEPADKHIENLNSYDSEAAFSEFKSKVYPKSLLFAFSWTRIAGIAASVLILLSIGFAYHSLTNRETSIIDNIAMVPAVNDSVPQIVLSDGTKVGVVDGIKLAGMTAKFNGTTIVLTEEEEAIIPDRTTFEEIIIPRGRMYKVELPDGTKILLNSESSLRFPNRFADQRNVALQGEAYFEVAKDGRPFNVTTNRGTIRVLGTTFSVSSYKNRPFSVSLTSGKIRFVNQTSSETLSPGQTLSCTDDGKLLVSSSDQHNNMAWMEGLITFENANLESIMDDITRMYDVNVHYTSEDMRHINFTGECSRFKNVDDFMRLLGLTEEFDFEIDGNDIYIRSKE